MKQIYNTVRDKKNKKFKDIKRITKLFLRKILFKFFKKSFVILNVSKEEYDLDIFDETRKLNSPKKNIKLTSKLKKEYPDNVLIQLRHAIYSNLNGNKESYDEIKSYWSLREKLISKKN